MIFLELLQLCASFLLFCLLNWCFYSKVCSYICQCLNIGCYDTDVFFYDSYVFPSLFLWKLIPACWDEISTRPAETDFTPRLQVEIKFHLGKTGQCFFWQCYLIILNIICMHFLWIFFCKRIILQHWRFIDFHWFKIFLYGLFSLQLCPILFHKIRCSRSQMFFKIGVLQMSQYSQENISFGVPFW